MNKLVEILLADVTFLSLTYIDGLRQDSSTLISFYVTICVMLFGCTLLFLEKVLLHIKLCKEDEK